MFHVVKNIRTDDDDLRLHLTNTVGAVYEQQGFKFTVVRFFNRRVLLAPLVHNPQTVIQSDIVIPKAVELPGVSSISGNWAVRLCEMETCLPFVARLLGTLPLEQVMQAQAGSKLIQSVRTFECHRGLAANDVGRPAAWLSSLWEQSSQTVRSAISQSEDCSYYRKWNASGRRIATSL